MRGTGTVIGLSALLALVLALVIRTLQPDPVQMPAIAAGEPAAPRPRSESPPKPEAPASKPNPAPAPGGGAGKAAEPLPLASPPARPPSSPSQGAFASPPVVCEPGKAVLYDGPKAVTVWVTRSGLVTVDNPLRPLTPQVTRVLQLVIGDKLATAYGPDLNAVRRGGLPSVLEAQLGGPIRWNAALGTLPDSLDIIADSGASLAELRFKACGDAPAVKAAPVAKAKKDDKPKPKPVRKPPAPAEAGSPGAPGAPPAAGAPPPRPFNLPQGAIAE